MKDNPMTIKGKLALETELLHLIRVERESVKRAIAEARELGDLRENAEYHAAKEKQGHIEGRIMELQSKLAKAKVIDPSSVKGDKVVFGATVTLFETEKESQITYQIVGNDEANPKDGKISYEGPIARALIGKEEGDVVIVKAPKGDIEYEIITIDFV